MYGLISAIKAAPERQEELIAILRDNETGMPGCRSYQIARDKADPDLIWITEIWETPQDHKASLNLPSVQNAVARARPMITGFAHRFETEPV
jgi:quinol monooxygenase YgiN